MSLKFVRTLSILALILSIVPCSHAAQQNLQEGKIYVWVAREYNSWDNPLQSEFSINGETVDIFSTETFEPIEEHLKPGWNDIAIKTTPQEPASKKNELIFRIGPMYRDPKNSARIIMSPIIWEFRNGTDWKFSEGRYSNSLGPNVKEVTLSYHVYWAGLEHEGSGLKTGDYILQAKPKYNTWNSPVVATVFVNGTPLNSFLLSERQVDVTSLLKPGKNEVKLVSNIVRNSVRNNDIECFIGGPAEWYAGRNQFMVKPITSFKAMQGWTKDAKSGQLNNPSDPNADSIEHTIAFMVKKEGPKPAKQ
jgi:hypothetical protein